MPVIQSPRTFERNNPVLGEKIVRGLFYKLRKGKPKTVHID